MSAVIRYRTKPESADENQRLIENVFADLATEAPAGLRYSSFRLADGVTFVHVVDGEGLPKLAAFQSSNANSAPDSPTTSPARRPP